MTSQELLKRTIEDPENLFLELFHRGHMECPDCASINLYKLKSGRYKCKECGRVFSIKTGTVTEHSNLSISTWLQALYFIITSTYGISSLELAKKLSVTQTTSYFLLNKVRFLLKQDSIQLGAEVAMDEYYHGGNCSRFKLSRRQNLCRKFNLPLYPKTPAEKIAIANKINQLTKHPIIGMNDGRRIVLMQVPNLFYRSDVKKIFDAHCSEDSVIVSDSTTLYDNLSKEIHKSNHSKLQFITEDGRTSNKIEGTFSHIDRHFLSRHTSISSDKLQLYLNEFSWKWNHRRCSVQTQMMNIALKLNKTLHIRDLRHFNGISSFGIREREIFDPGEVFKLGLVREFKQDGIVYRYDDWIKQPDLPF